MGLFISHGDFDVDAVGMATDAQVVALAKNYNVKLPICDKNSCVLIDEHGARKVVDGNILPAYKETSRLMRDADDFRMVVKDHLSRTHIPGCMYTEITTPELENNGMESVVASADEFLKKLKGIAQGILEEKKEASIVVSSDRALGFTHAMNVLEIAQHLMKSDERYKSLVRGFHLAGVEVVSPYFKKACDFAREIGLGISVDAVNTKRIQAAWELLGDVRIVNGYGILDDYDLHATLANAGILFQTTLSEYANEKDFLRHCFGVGLPMALGSKRPGITKKGIDEQYKALCRYGFDGDMVVATLAMSHRKSFALPAVKTRLLRDLKAWRKEFADKDEELPDEIFTLGSNIIYRSITTRLIQHKEALKLRRG